MRRRRGCRRQMRPEGGPTERHGTHIKSTISSGAIPHTYPDNRDHAHSVRPSSGAHCACTWPQTLRAVTTITLRAVTCRRPRGRSGHRVHPLLAFLVRVLHLPLVTPPAVQKSGNWRCPSAGQALMLEPPWRTLPRPSSREGMHVAIAAVVPVCERAGRADVFSCVPGAQTPCAPAVHLWRWSSRVTAPSRCLLGCHH